VTVRQAVLPIGAVLVLGLGVYLFIEVRSQAEPPPADPGAPRAPLDTASVRSQSPPPARPASPPAAAAREPAPARSAAAAPAPVLAGSEPAPPDPELVGPRLDAVMDEANKAYDRGEFDDARAIAARLLVHYPGNVRMLRIMVSASCMEGDAATAQPSYARLPAPDQAQMRTRCARFGVAFPDKP
jgi:hypothetical protein